MEDYQLVELIVTLIGVFGLVAGLVYYIHKSDDCPGMTISSRCCTNKTSQ